MSVPTLLNPIIGPKPKIVWAGLMTGDQCNTAKRELLYMLQGILERKSPIEHESSSEGSEGDSDNDLFLLITKM